MSRLVNLVQTAWQRLRQVWSRFHIDTWSFLIFSVPILATASLFIAARPIGFILPSIKIVITCLLISIVLYHIYFYLFKTTTPRNITRYIDYVYLSWSFLGLVATAAAINQQDVDVFSRSMVRQGTDYARIVISKYDKVETEKCGPIKDPHVCRALEELKVESKHDVGLLTSSGSDSIYNLRLAMERLKQKEALIASFGVSVTDFDDGPDNILALTKNIPSGAEFADPFGSNRWREIGLFLLAAAVAMRITRVSIEIWRWHVE